jgi:transcriptional regulator with XRE-family HTH domain
MKLHEKIKRLRKEHGMSQARLAELTGVHKAHFSRLERGVYQPSVDLLRKIAQALNVTADYLLNDEVDEITPVKVEDKSLLEKVKLIDTLDPEEKGALLKIIDALLTKKKVIDLVMKESGLAGRIPNKPLESTY